MVKWCVMSWDEGYYWWNEGNGWTQPSAEATLYPTYEAAKEVADKLFRESGELVRTYDSPTAVQFK